MFRHVLRGPLASMLIRAPAAAHRLLDAAWSIGPGIIVPVDMPHVYHSDLICHMHTPCRSVQPRVLAPASFHKVPLLAT